MSILAATCEFTAAAGLLHDGNRVQIGKVTTQLDTRVVMEVWLDCKTGQVYVEAPCGCRSGFSMVPAVGLALKSYLEHKKEGGNAKAH